MIDESLISKVVSLSPEDRLQLIGVVWDTLAPEDLPVTNAERALLDDRLAEMESDRTIKVRGPRQRLDLNGYSIELQGSGPPRCRG